MASISYVSSKVRLPNPCVVKWTPSSATEYFILEFSLGSWSKSVTISPASTSEQTYSMTLPSEEIASQIMDGSEGQMNVKLTTYVAGPTDTSSATVTVLLKSDDFTPDVSISISRVSSSDEDLGLYVQGRTRIKVNVTVETKYDAAVSMVLVFVNGTAYTSGQEILLSQSGNVGIYAQALDSRGNLGISSERVITVHPYSAPKLLPVTGETSVICAKSDSSGNLDDDGTYLKIAVKRGYSYLEVAGVQNNTCTISYRYKASGDASYSAWTTFLSSSTVSDEKTEVLSGIITDADKAYIVQLRATDNLDGETISTFNVSGASIQSHEVQNGFSFGERAEAFAFSVAEHWTAKLKGPVEIGGTALADHIVEVGDGYRKWKSKRAEAWGSVTVSQSSAATTAGGFNKSQSFGIDVPIIFNTAVCLLSTDTEDSFVLGKVTMDYLTAIVYSLQAISSGQSFNINYHIIGTTL